ncbi:MAG: hypothetical protein Kow0019_19020 [Methanobacteriaceae archaeon]
MKNTEVKRIKLLLLSSAAIDARVNIRIPYWNILLRPYISPIFPNISKKAAFPNINAVGIHVIKTASKLNSIAMEGTAILSAVPIKGMRNAPIDTINNGNF